MGSLISEEKVKIPTAQLLAYAASSELLVGTCALICISTEDERSTKEIYETLLEIVFLCQLFELFTKLCLDHHNISTLQFCYFILQ